MSFFFTGAPIAASQRFGGLETDIFSIGVTGQIGVSWATAAGAWNQPLPLTPINTFPLAGNLAAIQQFGTATPQTDVFAVDMQGTLNVLHAGAPGSSYQRFQIGLPNTYLPGAPLAAAGHPGSLAIQTSVLPETDVFVIAKDGGLDVHYVLGGGIWQVMELWPRHIAAPG